MGAPGYVTIAEARLARLLDAFAEVEEAVNVFAAGFIEAECMWRWRGFALIAAEVPLV